MEILCSHCWTIVALICIDGEGLEESAPEARQALAETQWQLRAP